MINTNIRNEVRQRAVYANSEKEMGGIIFAALRDNDLDWREVGNDNVKQLLVDAIRAFRGTQVKSSLRVAV